MNASDQKKVLAAIAKLAAEYPDVPVIAFDARAVLDKLLNVGGAKALADINDLLSHTDVCQELGTVFTVCEFEGTVLFLIRANKAFSVTERFDPDLLTFKPKAPKSAAEAHRQNGGDAPPANLASVCM